MPNLNAPMLVQNQLNRCLPSASDAKLGDLLAELIARVNAQNVAIRVLTAKLDLDAGVTDTNYTALTLPTAYTIKDLENRY